MSEWNNKYVSTNFKPGAKQYSKEFFLTMNSDLTTSQPELKGFSFAIVVGVRICFNSRFTFGSILILLLQAATCYAIGRADMVGQFFDYLTSDLNEKESELIFLRLREVIIFLYLGLPSYMPACYGIIGVVQCKSKQFALIKKL